MSNCTISRREGDAHSLRLASWVTKDASGFVHGNDAVNWQGGLVTEKLLHTFYSVSPQV